MSDSKYLKGPFKADFHGGYVFAGPENFMFGQVRGWGQLQYQKDAEAVQNTHLQFMVDALNEKASGETDSKEMIEARKAMSEIGVEKGKLPGLIEALKGQYKLAGEEIADLAHPEFGETGRLQEEIDELKKENKKAYGTAQMHADNAIERAKENIELKREIEWLTFYKREVYQCLGAGVDDVNKELRDAYVKKMGIGGVPEKLRKEYLDYEADHKED